MSSSALCDPSGLFTLARRRNPRRAMLVVSTVLAKHLPADASTVLGAGGLLATRAAAELPNLARPMVLGFCETAVGLGATVADALGAEYVHSTRYPRPRQHHLVSFVEAHSHAPNHVIVHPDPDVLASTEPLVLVDDELTTGKTALAAIEQIHARWPRQRYVIAALLDWRGPDDAEAVAAFEARTGASITVVSLHHGARDELVTPNPGIEEPPAGEPSAGQLGASADGLAVTVLRLPDVEPATPFAAGSAAHHGAADRVAAQLADRAITAVVGVEECMFLPILVAARLGVTAQSTTLSPVVVSRDAGYPIRSAVAFPSPFGGGDAYAYNIAEGARVAVITDGGAFESNLHMATAIARHTGAPVDLVLTGAAARACTDVG